MALSFETIINLTEYENNVEPMYVGSLMIANEPDNSINQFYIYNDRASDKGAVVDNSNYTKLEWSGPNVNITSDEVARIGVKSFPRIGAMAFYTLLAEERSKILTPVFVKKTRYTRPSFTYTQANGKITFTMTTPPDITYVAWRIVMRNGYQAFEYISYDDTITIDEPYIPGEYETYVIGYAGEGEAVSDDSNKYIITVTTQGIDPIDMFNYYTKVEVNNITSQLESNVDGKLKQLEEMIGQVGTLLDRLNGTVV